MVTFDGANRCIILPSIGTYDAGADLYSDWKEWTKTGDNAKFAPAFDTIGGEPIGAGLSVAPYFFLRTDLGWKLQMPEESGTVTITGNLYPRTDGDPIENPPTGPFTVNLRQLLSSQAIAVDTSGGSGPTAEEIAQEVWCTELPVVVP